MMDEQRERLVLAFQNYGDAIALQMAARGPKPMNLRYHYWSEFIALLDEIQGKQAKEPA